MRAIKKFSRKYHVKKIISLFLAVWIILAPVPWAVAELTPSSTALPVLPGGIGSDPSNFDRNLGTSTLTLNDITNGTVIGWDNFDIGSAATVTFTPVTGIASVLNRVGDGNPTGIMGH